MRAGAQTQAGFTMMELMITTIIMATVLAGLFSLQDALLQQRGRILRAIMVRNQNDYARRVILRELAAATLIRTPGIGQSGTELVGWKNLDTSNMSCDTACCTACQDSQATSCTPTCVMPTLPAFRQIWRSLVDLDGDGKDFADDAEWFRFCLANGKLYYYKGSAGNQLTQLLSFPTTVDCGDPAGNPETLAGEAAAKVVPFTGGSIFSRPPQNNWVSVEFSVVSQGTVAPGVLETAKADTTTGVQVLAGNKSGLNPDGTVQAGGGVAW